MNRKNLITKIIVCAALIFPAGCFATAQNEVFQAVEAERIPGILRSISKQTKENFEQIHTWQGELESSRYFIHKGGMAKGTFERHTDAAGASPNEIAELDSSFIVFRCDLDKGLFYSKVCRQTPTRYFDPADGRDLGTKSITDCGSHIVTGEYRLSSDTSVLRKGEVVQRKATKEKIEKDDSSYVGRQPVYLPGYLFDIKSQVWEYYPFFAKNIEEKGEYVLNGLALKVEQRTLDGDVQYRVHEPLTFNVFDINNIWTVRTFSTNAGYNMISSETRSADGGQLMHQKSMEYQKVNGVYVPIRGTEDKFDYSDYKDFSLRTHKEWVFKNVRINEPIPAETFTYRNLGLKDDDKFVDKILDREYIYKNEELVPIKKED